MNGEHQFENRLKTQMVKPLPAAWRREILDTARAAAGKDAFHRVPNLLTKIWGRGGTRPYLSLVTSAATRFISRLVWPSGKAWAGLAAVWVMIIGFNFANGDSISSAAASTAAPRSALVRELLQQQGRLFVELAGPTEDGDAIPSRHPVSGPRSQRERRWGQA